ncbi:MULTISPECIES: hypothetical protein [unclassified Polaromonas]|jgi:hypothetical protein|nr:MULTISPECIES: hypothetical protein [unclassified Polaromonas]
MTGFDVLFAAAGNLYLLLALAGICVALWVGKTWVRKLTYAVLVLALFIAPIAPQIYRAIEYRGKLTKAQALFDERCKTAGEKIYKTVDGVEGVAWMKWRPSGLPHDQFALDDPYGKDCSGEGCILKLLRVNETPAAAKAPNPILSSAYKFVETIDPSDGIRYRYKGISKAITDVSRDEFLRHVQRTGYGADTNGRFSALQREPIDKFSVDFGIVWDDVSTRADREYWIAGGSLKVIDIRTNEVIAERLGYLIDTGQGSTAGAREPWGWAQSYAPKCPQQPKNSVDFVIRVLKPAK